MAELSNKKTPEIQQKYVIKSNTLERVVKSDSTDNIQVEIGDSKQADFKPQVKISRWDNEVNFSMRAQEHPEAQVVFDGEIVKYITPEYEVHQYDKPEAGEDGGFEFEWVLPSKPISNELVATIQTKELDFFYQPALTQQEIDEGAFRPDHVVGSYAAFHSTKRDYVLGQKNYKVGKAFHIYRPEAIDANGVRVWCDIIIDKVQGKLVVQVPQEFLDTAAYPIKVDPTFGYTSIGGSGVSNENRIVIAEYALSGSATVTKMSIHFNTVPAAYNNLAGIFNTSKGRLHTSIQKSVSATGWNDFTFTVDPSLTAATYGLATYGDTVTGNPFVAYDTDAAVYSYQDLRTYDGTFPATAGVDVDNVQMKVSIYATYSGGSSASSSISPSPSASVSPSSSVSRSISLSPSFSLSPSPSASVSPSTSVSSSPSPSPSPSLSVSLSPSLSPSLSSSLSPSPSLEIPRASIYMVKQAVNRSNTY